MTDQSNDLTISLPRGITAVAIFGGDEVLVLRDHDGGSAMEFANPIHAAVMSARLRAWADFIDERTIPLALASMTAMQASR